MSNLTADQAMKLLHWRYAVKSFDSNKKIPDDAWDALQESLLLAPSSFGLQPWKFIIVDDNELRGQLRAASWNQAQVTQADRYVVFAALRTTTEHDVDRLMQRTSDVRGTPIESLSGYRNVIADFLVKGWAAKDLFGWNARQTYIALGQLMTTAAAMGIDTCPMEGIDVHAYDKALTLQDTRYATLCACAVGYRSDEDKYAAAAKVRYQRDEVIERR